MPPIRFSALERCLWLVLLIFSLSKIMPLCSHYMEKRLSYIAISAPFSRQPFSCTKCTRVNMQLSYNIYLVSAAKYIYLYTRYNLLVLYLSYLRVLYSSVCYKT